MKPGQKGLSQQRKRKGGRSPARTPLSAHRAFAPLLGAWGAALGAGVVMVLPSALVSDAMDGTLIGTWGQGGQIFLAATAASLLGGSLYAFASGMSRRARRNNSTPSVVEFAVRQVTPINPARDLGTRSLDEPLEAMPFSTPAWRDAGLDTPRRSPEPRSARQEPVRRPEPVAETVAEPAAAPAPVELDLADFAELPGRNAVWVDEAPVPAPEPAPEPAAAAPEQSDPVADMRARRLRAVTPPPPAPGTAALARLRAMPASELSLVEMVERFAGALHEHREMPAGHTPNPAELAAREAALAEALRALAALSGGAPAAARRPSREDPLRAALAQLQPRREMQHGHA
ncbi:MAG TPA: hypothetical protein VI407_01930 [Erythrobacter sp.]